jgi:hypothetical protein
MKKRKKAEIKVQFQGMKNAPIHTSYVFVHDMNAGVFAP